MGSYSEYKDINLPSLGKVPTHWNVIPNGCFFREKTIKNTNGEQNLSVYRDYGVIPRDSRDDNHNRVSDDISSYKLVEVGDFVLNKMKCWMGSLGVSDHRGIVSPSYTVCEPTRKIHRRFFHYLLRSQPYIQIYESLSYGVRVGQWELRYHDFKTIKSVCPPLQEQTLISKYLDKKISQIDSLIEKIERKIELLKEQKTSLINQCVTKGLDSDVEMKHSEVEWIGEIPSHWDLVPMKYITTISSGSTPKSEVERYWNGSINWYTPSDLGSRSVIKYLSQSTRKITELGLNSCGCNLVKADSVILSTRAPVGKVSISKVDFATNQGCKSLSVRENLDVNFLYYYLSVNMDALNSISNGTTFLELSTDSLLNFPIALPSLNEQTIISNYLDKKTSQINSLIGKETSRIELLKEYRQSLISNVVTGKLRVTEDMI